MVYTDTYTDICTISDLPIERGVAALIGAEQVAVIRLFDDQVVAVQNHDPIADANVLSRGIIGSRTVEGKVRPTLCSPIYKQVYALDTGECLDPAGADPTTLRRFAVKVERDRVLIGPAVGLGVPSGDLGVDVQGAPVSVEGL